MGCCGEKRAELRTQTSAPPARVAEPDEGPGVAVEYRGDAPVLLRGRASGRLYTFSAGRRVRQVAAIDVRHLIRSPLFAKRGRSSNGTSAESG
jgi:hypothetical protein